MTQLDGERRLKYMCIYPSNVVVKPRFISLCQAKNKNVGLSSEMGISLYCGLTDICKK